MRAVKGMLDRKNVPSSDPYPEDIGQHGIQERHLRHLELQRKSHSQDVTNNTHRNPPVRPASIRSFGRKGVLSGEKRRQVKEWRWTE